MNNDSQEIASLLASTESELYAAIGAYLEGLEEDGDFAELFGEEEDCQRIGIPIEDGSSLKDFIVSRSEGIISEYSKNEKSRLLLLKAQRLKEVLKGQNSSVYQQIGDVLFLYQVHCHDIHQVDDLKRFLSKRALNAMGLKNAAKQKLAFRKVLRIISEVQKEPEPKQEPAKQKEKDEQKEKAPSIEPQSPPEEAARSSTDYERNAQQKQRRNLRRHILDSLF